MITCDAVTSEHKDAGEMIDSKTGELIKWGIGTMMYVKLPGEAFHSLVKVPGHLPLGSGKADYSFGVRGNKPILVFREFRIDPSISVKG